MCIRVPLDSLVILEVRRWWLVISLIREPTESREGIVINVFECHRFGSILGEASIDRCVQCRWLVCNCIRVDCEFYWHLTLLADVHREKLRRKQPVWRQISLEGLRGTIWDFCVQTNFLNESAALGF
jgi:hypothetical protein